MTTAAPGNPQKAGCWDRNAFEEEEGGGGKIPKQNNTPVHVGHPYSKNLSAANRCLQLAGQSKPSRQPPPGGPGGP